MVMKKFVTKLCTIALFLMTIDSLIAMQTAVNNPSIRFENDNARQDMAWAIDSVSLKSVEPLVTLQAALDNKVSPNIVTQGGETPLLVLIKRRAPNLLILVDQLIAAGADLNKADSNRITPLMSAAMTNNAAIVQKLLDKGADSQAKTVDNKTALDLARDYNAVDAAEVLKKWKAAKDQKGIFLELETPEFLNKP